MKKILFLAADLCSGGAERQMVTIARLLKMRGNDVAVYCYEEADFYADLLQQAGIPIIWKTSPNYLVRIIDVRNYIKKSGYDTVISFLPTCNFLNNVAAMGKHDWKVITGERSVGTSMFTTKKGHLFAWFLQYSNFIVCNSQNAANEWVKHFPQLKSKLKVIYNTVCLGEVNASYQLRIDGKTHIVVAATYQYLKNPVGLVRALLLMTEEERQQIVIEWYGRKLVGGSAQAYDETLSLVEQYHLHDVLHLNMDTSEIANKMNQADAVMLLSSVEGLPNVICEAMTLAKPIIMSRVSDYSVLVDASNGFLCDWEEPETIKMAILSLARCDSKKLQQMGVASKQKADLLFDAEKVIQQWLYLINS